VSVARGVNTVSGWVSDGETFDQESGRALGAYLVNAYVETDLVEHEVVTVLAVPCEFELMAAVIR
jgi:hypothetical protein